MIFFTDQRVSLPSPLVKPLDDNNWIINLIAEITHESVETVRHNLEEEEIHLGRKQIRDFHEQGLLPHVWSEEMNEFYKNTDAFLYNLVAWNRNHIKLQMRDWIGKYLSREKSSPLDILCLGDGLGIDTLYLAQAGHHVTYYDVPGYTETFARRLFKDSGLAVSIVNDIQAISKEAYDVVLCLDVLEHVSDPPSFVAEIAGYLRFGGKAIIHAPFYLVNENYLTHLKSNQKYSGRLNLFTKQGLHLVDGQLGWNPIVLRKIDHKTQLTTRWNLHLWSIRLIGLYIAISTQIWGNPFFWIIPNNRSMLKIGSKK
ncbi:MAG: class I SAM-dependent methyltransferase [Nostoc sp. GBBB01]|jgi:SAM-dependent methyltransferase|uniref:Class I SAM-dependent methyltransferase n=1 Tax=Nostoc punctiforme FACHB-252 TaxID=1357509 RepID=A0ABR8HE15_NOSPU|nr:class I SAM-dependent methyltransferase [Nostoc punctiforme]MBD2613435.1 class I SAM-dependent methyltransferase [Nostoc punctiforme FACHB-252]MBL1198699.1 class I SAM-dependent methyltransferase [Nostoc sp. GBBB01]